MLFVTRNRQVSGEFACYLIDGLAHDLSAIIDVAGVIQKQGGARRNKGVEVRHHAVLPEERAAVGVGCITRVAYHLAFVVDATAEGQNAGKPATNVPGQRAEVGDHAVGRSDRWCYRAGATSRELDLAH